MIPRSSSIIRGITSHKMITDFGFSPSINALVNDLDQISPRFELNGDQIDIIHDPKEFYTLLKNKIAKAEKRIFISSLYIGKTQTELIGCISDALKSKPNLKVHILTDALRGTREAPLPSSASLLSQLTRDHDSQVDIRMYHTPKLNGIFKAMVPNRFNEGFGLQHMKIYGFDDEVILSGANLSSDYFTNRQDRYYLFSHNLLSEYYFDIQQAIGSLSYKLFHSDCDSKFKLDWPTTNPVGEPTHDPQEFIDCSSKILKELLRLKRPQKDSASITSSQSNTFVYPASQFTPLMMHDYSTEKPTILRLLKYANDSSVNWTFTAGYFNMLPEIKEQLLASKSKGDVITASPLANGFYKSKGVSGYLPEAYLYLSKQFLEQVKLQGRFDSIKLREWKRGTVNTEGGWSYHAKGLWATSPAEVLPSITVIGSSNYTRRAYSFDLETNAIVITKDEQLKAKMGNEVANLKKYAQELDIDDYEEEERYISKFAKFATNVLGRRL